MAVECSGEYTANHIVSEKDIMLLQKSPERKRLLDLEFLVLTPQTVGLLNHSDQKNI